MRLTNSTLLRGYNRDLQRLKTEKNNCERKITSTRKFSRASEAPLSAAKALNVRKSQYYSAQYKENLNVAAKFYTEAETSLLQVSEKMAEIRETIIAAVNTTKDQIDYNIYAQQLETRAQELCAIFNTDSAGRAIFGGESDSSMPFSIINDSTGRPATVLYHNVPVNAMDDYNGFPYSNKVYMDIGLGMVTDQAAHTQDPMSVLDISFHGTKITGCGAEYGVADIDLTSIKENRNYVLDIYADGRKQTIAFRGQATQAGNVSVIQEQLFEAYKKDFSYGRSIPTIDNQGVIYLISADGTPLENGVACAVNSTSVDMKRTEQLVIDNDSNYTNKFKLNTKDLPENTEMRVIVDVDGEKAEISFMTGEDDLSDPDHPIYREDVAIKNFQAALDKDFGVGKVNVSTHYPNKGVISSEGGVVKLGTPAVKEEEDRPAVTKAYCGALDLDAMSHDGTTLYTVRAEVYGKEYDVTFRAANNYIDTFHNAVQAVCDACGGSFAASHCWSETGLAAIVNEPINFLHSTAGNAAPVKTNDCLAIDFSACKEGEEYEFYITYNNMLLNDYKTKITITGGKDGAQTAQNFRKALGDEIADTTVSLGVGDDGRIVALNRNSIQIETKEFNGTESMPFERERIYSKNYIQLTLDAARALRNGDIEYANGCIDRIVTASENLLGQIADLGCNEDFIDFNLERLTVREENLAERQNELEITDPEYQITLWKTYEAYYNACLQMSSSVIPNSIFNYMK